jgi:tetratricopeptide (TPR) repeat protein
MPSPAHDGNLAGDPGSDPRAVAIHQELFFGGPKSSTALIAALAGQGVTLTDDDLDDLLDAGEVPHVVELTDGDEPLYLALDNLLDDRVFTHRLSAAEIAAGVLTIEPDLKPLMALTDAPPFDRLEDGSPIVEVFTGESVDPEGSLIVAAGTLASANPGDLIGVGVGAGGLRIRSIGEFAAAPADLADHVTAVFDGDEDGRPVMLDELVWRLCNDDIGAFRQPLPPLTELLATSGLERSGDVVAPAGFDFSTWGLGHQLAELARQYEITDLQAAAVITVRDVFLDVSRLVDEQAGDDPTGLEPADRDAGPLMELPDVPLELADAAVAEAVFWETVGEGVKEAVALGVLVESWEPHATHRVRPALAWLRGKCLERLGNVRRAEAAFDESLSLNPGFAAALIDMARYATDRGDAARAIALLERAGFTAEDPLVGQLRARLPVERTDVGRNDPCWCGSGRKYKRCHLGRTELGPSEQAEWLYDKAVHYAHDAPHGELLLDLAAIRAAALATDPMSAAGDHTVLDVTLFEGGVLAAFLAARGVLLPPAERLLAASWLPIERSVFDVTGTLPGTGVTLQDLRTGQSQDVPDVLLSKSAQLGDLLCTRLLPVGDTVEIHGSIDPVPLHVLDSTLAALAAPVDPYDLMTTLSERFKEGAE